MDIGYIVKHTYGGTEILTYRKTALSSPAELALRMVERWGMICCIPEGEDSAGRGISRLMTPEELIARACAVAELAISEFDKRGLVLHLPAPEMGDK